MLLEAAAYKILGFAHRIPLKPDSFRNSLKAMEFGEKITTGTVHRFQGDERRIMLLEIPESHGGFWALGRLIQGLPPEHEGARLMNVAISRAMDHLIVLANLTYLDKKLPSLSLLRSILYEMQKCGRIVSGKEILALRPIENDLAGLFGQVALDSPAENIGII